MTPYPKYKPSGIEWIGEIPEHWEVKKLKRFAKILNGQDQKEIIADDGIYPIYGTGGEFGRTNTFLHVGPSVILGRKGTIDKPRFVDTPFWSVDTAYYTDISPITNPRFFYYCCLTINFELYKYGSAVPSMSQEVLSQIPFCSPSLEQQSTIAAYLDQKTTLIDTCISKKQTLIALLKEEKTALINDAVTKGIDPNVKLKPSGIAWLGDVPEHWEVKKLKYLGNIISGASFDSSQFIKEGDVKILKISNIQHDYIDWNDGEFISDDYAANYMNFRLKNGDIVFALTRPIISSGIKSSRVFFNDTEIVLLNQRNAIIRALSIIDPTFLYYITHSNYFFTFFELSIDNTGQQPNISSIAISNFNIAFPPYNEQLGIVKKIETERAKIDHTITRIEKEIELMQEYRVALISEVVTGKVKV